MEGKLTGNAIRVPTPNVSMAVANPKPCKGTNKEELNEYLWNGDLQLYPHRLIYTDSTEIVSTDLVGSRHPGVVDGVVTIAQDTIALFRDGTTTVITAAKLFTVWNRWWRSLQDMFWSLNDFGSCN